uniref:Cytochrome P450 n=1 Tax=Psilocybe cubensis TaxID=181762 RepID=A0A8H7XVA8_PSICU
MRLLEAFISRNREPYPPGPLPKFLIGNILDMPSVDSPREFVKWEKSYNIPLLHAEVFGTHILIVNSIEDAIALFERPERASIYSDRPDLPILDLIGTEKNIGLMRYGEKWRSHRRVSHQNFNIHAATQYEPIQTRKVRDLLQKVLDRPDKFSEHNKWFSTAVTMSAMYGYEVKSVDDPCVALADEALRLIAQLIHPGGSLINHIPALRHIPEWFPGAYSRKLAARTKLLNEQVWRLPVEYVKKSLDEGTSTPSLVANFYEKKLAYGASEEEEVAMAAITYAFVYLMTIHPDIQQRARDEIENVIGATHRLPTLVDRKSLPYVEAIYREVLRLYPPLPLGLPRTTTEDNHYKGYYIPKGKKIFVL